MIQAWFLILLALEIVFYIWSAKNLLALGWSGWVVIAFIVVVVLLWRLSHALASFIATSFLRLADNRAVFIVGTSDALVREFTSRLITFNWSQPFVQLAMPREPVRALHTAANETKPTPVLLLHGYFSSRGMFSKMIRTLADSDAIGPLYSMNVGPPLGDIDKFATQLKHKIESICNETGADQVAIVAHSMGGLVTRAYLRAHRHERVAQIITIGSPHHGTKVSTFGVGRCTRQMRWLEWGNRWLAQLMIDERDRLLRGETLPQTLSIYTENDDIIYPAESSVLEWGENVVLNGVGHVGLLFDDRVMAMVAGRLRGEM
jgi:triacylglycerol lipase